MEQRDKKLSQILKWAEENPDVQVVLLTSSLVNPLAPVDNFSDLDVELVFRDNAHYVKCISWLENFGSYLAVYEESETYFSGVHAMKMVVYEDGIKVDFKLYSLPKFVGDMQKSELPYDWDIGYKVMIDRDNITTDLKAPTYTASLIQKPTKEAFDKVLHGFWWDIMYVAKCLARRDIFYAKFMSETVIRTEMMIPLIEWYIASQHDWKITTNKYGRLFPKYLTAKEWNAVMATFSGGEIKENIRAVWAMTDLFSQFGKTLAERLNYPYPIENEEKILNYLHKTLQIHA